MRVASDSPAMKAVGWVLRMSVALMCVGAAVDAWRSPVVGAELVETWRLAAGAGPMVDAASVWVLLAFAPLALCYPMPMVLLPLAGWMLIVALARTLAGGPFYELQIPVHACRWLAPLALALVVRWPRRKFLSLRRVRIMEWTLRAGAAMTFAGHGLEAIANNPEFVPLIAGVRVMVGLRADEAAMNVLLPTIGAMDLMLALAIVLGRFRFIGVYMAMWGGAAAVSRVIAGGFGAYPDMLLRLVNAGVPLALLLLWQMGRQTEVVTREVALGQGAGEQERGASPAAKRLD
jgi:hypothetical protein